MSEEPTKADKLAVYDRYAAAYEQRTIDYTSFLLEDYNNFYFALPGKRILDLGCGPGRDAQALAAYGLKPLCLDLSSEMLALCKAKGLETLQMDIEQLDLPANSFDGVWSHTSLTTIPKRKVWQALAKVQTALREDGVLFLGLIEGEGEQWKEPDAKYAVRRYISRYSKDEVVDALAGRFELEKFRRIDISESGRNSYLNFLFRKL